MRSVVAVAVAVLAAAAGCSLVGGGTDGYHLTARFDRAVGLYAGGDVTLMGVDVGVIDDVALEDTGVRVEMTIDHEVVLPADVQATIEPRTLIGERQVVLFPPWDATTTGPRAADGDVIPRGRTQVPVEPDEGLEAFNQLARGLDPSVVGALVDDSAAVLEGRGASLGALIEDSSTIVETIASLDEQLAGAATALEQLASSLDGRQAQLESLVDAFAEATEVLASERDSIRGFLASLVDLTDEGAEVLETYGDGLPADIAHLAALAHVLERNSGSVEELIESLPGISEGIAEAYQPDIDGLALRASANATLVALMDNLQSIVDDLLGGLVP